MHASGQYVWQRPRPRFYLPPFRCLLRPSVSLRPPGADSSLRLRYWELRLDGVRSVGPLEYQDRYQTIAGARAQFPPHPGLVVRLLWMSVEFGSHSVRRFNVRMRDTRPRHAVAAVSTEREYFRKVFLVQLTPFEAVVPKGA